MFTGSGINLQTGARKNVHAEIGFQWEVMGLAQDMALTSTSNENTVGLSYNITWRF